MENKPVTMDDEMPLPKKGGYNIDFDKFDDPGKRITISIFSDY